jgi:hypothetical protein
LAYEGEINRGGIPSSERENQRVFGGEGENKRKEKTREGESSTLIERQREVQWEEGRDKREGGSGAFNEDRDSEGRDERG